MCSLCDASRVELWKPSLDERERPQTGTNKRTFKKAINPYWSSFIYTHLERSKENWDMYGSLSLT